MRSSISTICSRSKQPNALAAIYYDSADTNSAPTSTAWNIPDLGTCANDDLSKTVPYYSLAPAQEAEYIQNLDINFAPNASNIFLWTINGQS
jgi:hypothetical protein